MCSKLSPNQPKLCSIKVYFVFLNSACQKMTPKLKISRWYIPNYLSTRLELDDQDSRMLFDLNSLKIISNLLDTQFGTQPSPDLMSKSTKKPKFQSLAQSCWSWKTRHTVCQCLRNEKTVISIGKLETNYVEIFKAINQESVCKIVPIFLNVDSVTSRSSHPSSVKASKLIWERDILLFNNIHGGWWGA